MLDSGFSMLGEGEGEAVQGCRLARWRLWYITTKVPELMRNPKILPWNWRLTLTSMVSLPQKPFAFNTLFLMSSCLSIRRSVAPSAWKRQRECHTVRTERSYHTSIFKERNPQKTGFISWGFNYETSNVWTQPRSPQNFVGWRDLLRPLAFMFEAAKLDASGTTHFSKQGFGLRR